MNSASGTRPSTPTKRPTRGRLGGLRRRKERTVAGAYDFEGLETVSHIRRLIEVAVVDTLSQDNSIARSRTLAYLAQVSVNLLEKGNLDERLRALEDSVRRKPRG